MGKAVVILTESRLSRTVDSFGFSAEGTLISAFTIPHRGIVRRETLYLPVTLSNCRPVRLTDPGDQRIRYTVGCNVTVHIRDRKLKI